MSYLTSLLLAGLLAIPIVAKAQDDDPYAGKPRWFQFEVLLFRNLADTAQREESWLTAIDLRMAQPSYRLPEIGNGDAAFQIWEPPTPLAGPRYQTPPASMLKYRGVSAQDLQMQALRNKLQGHGNYKVIDYRAWRQQLAGDGTPIYFHIEAGKTNDNFPEFEGYIGFYLKRYLHVDTELWWGDYTRYASGESTTAPPEALQRAGSYDYRAVARAGHLQEQRRMRSDEVHYFDHPLFGMLVRISPWQASP
jgi:hypothetical protein